MNLVGKQQLITAVRDRYQRASKKQKKVILDEFVASTGYHRKYALTVLGKKAGKPKPHGQRRRAVTYTPDIAQALTLIWNASNCIASRRLHPFLPEMVAVLERHDAMHPDDRTKRLLLAMSRSTIDRLLKPARRAARPHGRSTTKPGTLLKQSIPIRTWADWDDAQPGFVEIDLVAHCGVTTAGEYLATLNVVDISTGWCVCIVPKNRGQEAVRAALADVRTRLPMPLLGIDSDNDAAFINDHLKRYCDAEHITFTRSRPYKKNDQAHVEQKNWTVVRCFIGYDRFEGVLACLELNDLYRDIELYVNFFQPVMKLVKKTRIDGKVKKEYDVAQTPYQRVLSSPSISTKTKAELTGRYLMLNPITLKATIEGKLRHLWEHHAIMPGEQAPVDNGKKTI
jgi:hypothetical protein